MTNSKGVTVLAVVLCIQMSGCNSVSPDAPVCEYRIGAPVSQTTVTESGVFALWQWKVAPVADEAPHHVPDEIPVELTRVPVDFGSSIGFRKDAGKLIGFAGPTTMPLEEGHYSWQSLTGGAAVAANNAQQRTFAQTVGLVLLAPFAIIGGLLQDRFGDQANRN